MTNAALLISVIGLVLVVLALLGFHHLRAISPMVFAVTMLVGVSLTITSLVIDLVWFFT